MSFMRNFWASDTMLDFLTRGADGGGGVSTPATNGALGKPPPGLAGGALPVNPKAPAQSPPGNSASDQVQLTKRLGALVGPYKEAVSKNAPEAAQMQPLMAAVKQRIVERNFLAAGQALDELEAKLATGLAIKKWRRLAIRTSSPATTAGTKRPLSRCWVSDHFPRRPARSSQTITAGDDGVGHTSCRRRKLS